MLKSSKRGKQGHFKLMSQKNHLFGVICLALAMFVFVSLNAFIKTMEKSYPIIEIVFFRNLFALIPCLLGLLFQKNRGLLKASPWSVHFLRGFWGVISLCCLFESILRLPLSESTVFMFTASIFVTGLAFLFLGEKVGFSKLSAMIIGFLGVLIVCSPSQDLLKGGALFGLISAFIEAVLMVHNRKLSLTHDPLTITIYYLVFASILSSCLLIFFWETPTFYDALILVTLGIGAGIGQYLVTLAYACSPAALLSPVLYTAMIWSLLYGVFFFHETLSIPLILGAGLIILANLFVVFQENKNISL